MSNPFSEPSVNNPYTSTASFASVEPQGPPKVIFWCKAFAGVMSLVCFGVAGFCLLTLLIVSSAMLPPEQASQIGAIRTVYGVMLAIALLLAVMFLVFPILPKKPATWIYGMVLLGLSLVSLCGAIPAIALMIFWASEQTRRHYGVTT